MEIRRWYRSDCVSPGSYRRIALIMTMRSWLARTHASIHIVFLLYNPLGSQLDLFYPWWLLSTFFMVFIIKKSLAKTSLPFRYTIRCCCYMRNTCAYYVGYMYKRYMRYVWKIVSIHLYLMFIYAKDKKWSPNYHFATTPGKQLSQRKRFTIWQVPCINISNSILFPLFPPKKILRYIDGGNWYGIWWLLAIHAIS